jgi:hypothetical protein
MSAPSPARPWPGRPPRSAGPPRTTRPGRCSRPCCSRPSRSA